MKSSSSKDKLNQTEVDTILDEISITNQEIYREKALKLFGVEIPAGDNAKRLMQKAYLKYSTISSIKS